MNNPARMQRIQQLFHAALEHNGEPRTRFLVEACGDDVALRHEVEALLAAHEESDGFMSKPAIQPEEATLIQSSPSSQIISHYEVLSLLGKGGMGEVYLAADKSLGRKAALKILPARYTADSNLVNRFEREAKAVSALNHPNILTVYEIGRTDDSHFIATEFIEGETLRKHLQRAPISLTEALDIALQIAAALNAAHNAGIIHRDIKPENIMLRPDGYVKVLDFGLAKLTEGARNLDESTTQTGMIMGTPSYMSPEQARGQKVDARTDIWSFGVVLYELVCGARPFAGNTQADLLVSILEREPTPLPHHLPEGLRAIIKRTITKDPEHRYARTQDLLEDLKALRRKIEVESELKQIAREEQDETETIRQTAEAATLRLAPELKTNAAPAVSVPDAPIASPVVAAPSSAPSRVSGRVIGASIAILLICGIAVGAFYNISKAPPPSVEKPIAATPKRELTWWLTVQRMQGGKLEGKPFESNGRVAFSNGSRYKFNSISPQSGYLYLLNEGPIEGGKISLNLLYPTPANNNLDATVNANQLIQTGNYIFSQIEGDEKFWIVWSAQPITEIEAVKTATKDAEIQDAAASNAILQRLQQHVAQSVIAADEDKDQTKISGDDIVVQLVKLKHR